MISPEAPLKIVLVGHTDRKLNGCSIKYKEGTFKKIFNQ